MLLKTCTVLASLRHSLPTKPKVCPTPRCPSHCPPASKEYFRPPLRIEPLATENSSEDAIVSRNDSPTQRRETSVDYYPRIIICPFLRNFRRRTSATTKPAK